MVRSEIALGINQGPHEAGNQTLNPKPKKDHHLTTCRLGFGGLKLKGLEILISEFGPGLGLRA